MANAASPGSPSGIVPERHVFRVETTDAILGTATLIGKGLLLTARHVLHRETGDLIRPLQAVLPGGPTRPDPVILEVDAVWEGQGDVDVALLRVQGETTEGQELNPRVLLDPSSFNRVPWEASGFPEVQEKSPAVERTRVRGATFAWSPIQARIELEQPGPAPSWKGLSGALALVDGRVVGVIRAHEGEWLERLYATPTYAFLRDPGFEARLGPDDLGFEAWRGEVVIRARRRLTEHPTLVAALARVCGVEGAVESVLSALAATGHPAQLASYFNHADAQLHEASAAAPVRRALREALHALLPCCPDDRGRCAGLAQRMARRERDIREELGTAASTAVLHAGAVREPVAWAPSSGGLLGARAIRPPSLLGSSHIDLDGRAYADAVLALVRAAEPLKRLAPPTEDALRDDLAYLSGEPLSIPGGVLPGAPPGERWHPYADLPICEETRNHAEVLAKALQARLAHLPVFYTRGPTREERYFENTMVDLHTRPIPENP